MAKLSVEAVEDLLARCLVVMPTQDAVNEIEVLGIVRKFVFSREDIAAHADAIKILLDQLPDQFHARGGGGWSFLNACVGVDGAQWGEQGDVEALVCLGIAAGWARFCLPRMVWHSLPGGVPYVAVLAERKSI